MYSFNNLRSVLNLPINNNGSNESDFFNNLSATIAPTVLNDISQGYEPGSMWINTADDSVYTCTDNTLGNAVWKTSTLSIDDTSSNLSSTWSSQKINTHVATNFVSQLATTDQEINSRIDMKTNRIQSTHVPADNSDLTNKLYVDNAIPSIDGLATTTELNTAISNLNVPSIDGLALSSELIQPGDTLQVANLGVAIAAPATQLHVQNVDAAALFLEGDAIPDGSNNNGGQIYLTSDGTDHMSFIGQGGQYNTNDHLTIRNSHRSFGTTGKIVFQCGNTFGRTAGQLPIYNNDANTVMTLDNTECKMGNLTCEDITCNDITATGLLTVDGATLGNDALNFDSSGSYAVGTMYNVSGTNAQQRMVIKSGSFPDDVGYWNFYRTGTTTRDGGSTTWDSTCDRRLKQDITQCDTAMMLNAIDSLTIHRYRYKPKLRDDGTFSAVSDYRCGVITDELKDTVFANAIKSVGQTTVREPDGGETTIPDTEIITYDEIYTAMISAIQELSKRNAALEARIEILESA